MLTAMQTAEDAIAVLREWGDKRRGGISAAIVEWCEDSFSNWTDATAKDVVRHLEMTDCAACHAPHGLIYNREIAAKVGDWWLDIDEALAEYHDATGEHPRPRDGAMTVGWLVWFAVEWFAQDAASYLSSLVEYEA